MNCYRQGYSNHIDFISKEAWVDPVQMNICRYNNGFESGQNGVPFMSSNLYAYINSLKTEVLKTYSPMELTEVDYSEDGIYYYLPEELKKVIVSKQIVMSSRYQASGSLKDDNKDYVVCQMGPLWIPSEFEITGSVIFGNAGSSVCQFTQYPIFSFSQRSRVFYYPPSANNNTASVWTATPCSNSSTEFTYLSPSNGWFLRNGTADRNDCRPLICFRIC